jgi:hypothetical protein
MKEGLFRNELNPTSERTQLTADVIKKVITPAAILDVIRNFQGSQGVTGAEITRDPILYRLLTETAGIPDKRIKLDYRNSGVTMVKLYDDKPDTWVEAHKDRIGFFIGEYTRDSSIILKPNCAFRQEVGTGPYPAQVLRYVLDNDGLNGEYKVVSEGFISSVKEKNLKTDKEEVVARYTTDAVPEGGYDPGADRVMYKYEFGYDEQSQIVTGDLDNPAGMSALIVALCAVSYLKHQLHFKYDDLKLGVAFAGGEEGRFEESIFFARNLEILLNRTPSKKLPKNMIIVDGHDSNTYVTDSIIAEWVSDAKGMNVDPHVFVRTFRYLESLEQFDVHVVPTRQVGMVSRSNDVAARKFIHNTQMIGYDVHDPHFNTKQPSSHIMSIVNNSQAITWAMLNPIL